MNGMPQYVRGVFAAREQIAASGSEIMHCLQYHNHQEENLLNRFVKTYSEQ